MARSRRSVAQLLACAVAAQCLWRTFWGADIGAGFVELCGGDWRRTRRQRSRQAVARSASSVTERPPSRVPLKFPQQYRNFGGHTALGGQKPGGPVRTERTWFQRNLTNTLRIAVSERGSLFGRYRDEVEDHLNSLNGTREAIVYWDEQNMKLPQTWHFETRGALVERFFQWVAGCLGATIKRAEAVEVTPDNKFDERMYRTRKLHMIQWLRMNGGCVHRVWPPADNAADDVIIESIYNAVDKMKAGAPKQLITLITDDAGFEEACEQVQREGFDVVLLKKGDFRYFIGGANFSVGIKYEGMYNINRHRLTDAPMRWLEDHEGRQNMMKPDSEREKWEGPQMYDAGVVDLPEPSLEQEGYIDRRIFHDWNEGAAERVGPRRGDGSYREPGVLMNETLFDALKGALRREGTVGTRTGALAPEVKQALMNDLEDLSYREGERGERTAHLFFNHDDIQWNPHGPSRPETLARFVRWLGGYLTYDVRRVEVSAFVEPWNTFSGPDDDWFWSMEHVGMHINRVWPPKSEATNLALTRSIAAIARASEAGVTRYGDGQRIPRIVAIFSEDLYFDQALRDCQRAGVSALWFGQEERGLYYPANSDVQVRINVKDITYLMEGLPFTNNYPFLAGAANADAPPASWVKRTVPLDMHWGRIEDLQKELDPSKSLRSDLADALDDLEDELEEEKEEEEDDMAAIAASLED